MPPCWSSSLITSNDPWVHSNVFCLMPWTASSYILVCHCCRMPWSLSRIIWKQALIASAAVCRINRRWSRRPTHIWSNMRPTNVYISVGAFLPSSLRTRTALYRLSSTRSDWSHSKAVLTSLSTSSEMSAPPGLHIFPKATAAGCIEFRSLPLNTVRSDWVKRVIFWATSTPSKSMRASRAWIPPNLSAVSFPWLMRPVIFELTRL